MKAVVILLIGGITVAAIFGIASVLLELRFRKPKYEILMKGCYTLIGIIGAVLAWLAYLKF